MALEDIRRRSVRTVRRTSWAIEEFFYRNLAARLHTHEDNLSTSSSSLTDFDSVRPGTVGAPENPQQFRPRPVESVVNPVVTVGDVTDYGDAEYVADPFLFISKTEGWNLFFEVYNRDRRPTGVIGHATSTDAGKTWTYNEVVLQDEAHLAFPYVFEWDGVFYMIPDRWNREQPAAVQVFQTDSLPDGWRPVSTVVDPDRQLADCVVFRWNDKWWALLGSDDGQFDLLAYYCNDLLTSGWIPHDDNPVVTGRPTAARPAGRPIVGEDSILVFLQDCATQYGDKVRAYEINQLTSSEYADQERTESPVLEGTGKSLGWNSGRMHHIDPWYTGDRWLCAVDGNVQFGFGTFGPDHWAIGMYQT